MTLYEQAKAKYSKYGVDVEKAIETLRNTPVSLHCWLECFNNGYLFIIAMDKQISINKFFII